MTGCKPHKILQDRQLPRAAVFFACFSLCLTGSLMTMSVHSSKAYAQNRETENRLRRLENELETINQAIFRDSAQVNGADIIARQNQNAQSSANTELRLSQLEVDLRNMNGQIEELNFKMRQMQKGMDHILAQMELRLSDVEARVIASGSTAPLAHSANDPNTVSAERINQAERILNDAHRNPDAVPGSVHSAVTTDTLGNTDDAGTLNPSDFPTGRIGTLTVPAGQEDAVQTTQPVLGNGMGPNTDVNDPTILYDQAFSFLRVKDYDKAESAFQNFLNENPDHRLTANAQYWLGETYYVRNNFERAARLFAEGYKKFPDSSKGPDNLLKLGMSLAGLGKTKDACLTFDQLRVQYKEAPSAILTRARQEGEKIGCAS